MEWTERRDEYLKRMKQFEDTSHVSLSNPSGSILVRHGQYSAFKGEGPGIPYAVLGMCTSGGGRTRREMGSGTLDDVWRPGRVGLILPEGSASGFTPSMGILNVAFSLDDLPACHGRKLEQTDLSQATTQLYDDPLASSVMTALLHDAELHGTSTAFFEHGLSLVIHRLAELALLEPKSNAVRPQDHRLSKVLELIEDSLDTDLLVKDLAKSVNLDPRSFTRAFKQETTYTPFAYITRRRMEKAKQLLRSNMSVTDVSSTVGYANPAKFAAAFRRWVGCSPSEWKKQ